MPNFQKSKGFQLRSGNKAKAPFKMMGSSPAKNGILGLQKRPSLGVDNPFDKPRVKSEAEISFDLKQKLKKKPQTEKQKKKLDKAIKSDNKFIEKASERASKGKTTKPDKPGTVVSRTAKKVGKSIKEGAKNFGKAMQDPENQQKMRDLGAVVSNIGDPNTSMSSVIQGQADRKVAKADKITARKDKDIENANMVANTKRTNQRIAQATEDLEAGDGELPANTKVKAKNLSNTKSSVD